MHSLEAANADLGFPLSSGIHPCRAFDGTRSHPSVASLRDLSLWILRVRELRLHLDRLALDSSSLLRFVGDRRGSSSRSKNSTRLPLRRGSDYFLSITQLFVNVTSYEIAYTRAPARMKGLVYAVSRLGLEFASKRRADLLFLFSPRFSFASSPLLSHRPLQRSSTLLL